MCAMMEAHVAERPYLWPIAWSGKRATNTGNQSTGSSSKYSLECLHILRLEPRRVAELECRKVIANRKFERVKTSNPMWINPAGGTDPNHSALLARDIIWRSSLVKLFLRNQGSSQVCIFQVCPREVSITEIRLA